MPKPIVRKNVVGDDAFLEAHPEMKRSDVSTDLEKLSAVQKERLENLSPNAKVLLDAMKDANRYESLTDPDNGYIVKTEIEIERACLKAISAEEQVSRLTEAIEIPREPVHVEVEDGDAAKWSDEFWSKQSPRQIAADAHRMKIGALSAALAALKLAKLVMKLSELKAEAEKLEKKITDDSNLPDFAALQEVTDETPPGVGEQAAIICAEQPGECQIDIAQDTPVNEDNPHDHPIKWSYWYEAGGDVISPSREGAMAMAALRIKRTVVAEHINAWQEK